MRQADAIKPDLIVLDVMLPDIDGFEVCRRLRAAGNEVPVIFLTARDTSSDTVTGLAIGGDDYVTKPFSVEALVARVRAVLRRASRSAQPEQPVPATAPCAPATSSLTRRCGRCAGRGVPVELSPTEFRLLAYLMRHQGRVLTRAQLLENVWGWDYAGESQIVETYVSYLRRKLDPLGPPLIHTQRGVGYSLRLPEQAAAHKAHQAEQQMAGRARRRMTRFARPVAAHPAAAAADRGDGRLPADTGHRQHRSLRPQPDQPVRHIRPGTRARRSP